MNLRREPRQRGAERAHGSRVLFASLDAKQARAYLDARLKVRRRQSPQVQSQARAKVPGRRQVLSVEVPPDADSSRSCCRHRRPGLLFTCGQAAPRAPGARTMANQAAPD